MCLDCWRRNVFYLPVICLVSCQTCEHDKFWKEWSDVDGNLQTLICVLVARPRRCLTLSNPVPWQNWMAAYLGYTLRMRTLFRGWPIMVNDTHTRRRRRWRLAQMVGGEDMKRSGLRSRGWKSRSHEVKLDIESWARTRHPSWPIRSCS